MTEDNNLFRFSISSIIKVLTAIVALLFIASLSANYYYYTFNELAYIAMLFNLDKEGNIPTRFASGLLVGASFLFFIIYRMKKKKNDKFSFHWLFLSLVFLLMGLDESVQLHEQTSQLVKMHVKGLHFAWVIPGAIFVLLFGLAYIKFFMKLDSRWKKLFFISAVIFITGALGIEVVNSFFQGTYGQENFGYVLMTNIEEMFEFTGVILLLYTQMSFIMEANKCYSVELTE